MHMCSFDFICLKTSHYLSLALFIFLPFFIYMQCLYMY